jgi:hypothetical protein
MIGSGAEFHSALQMGFVPADHELAEGGFK